MRGVGQKSARTEALELHKLGWPVERIALAVETDLAKVCEWVHGKPKARPGRRAGVSPATPEQRARVKGRACVYCRKGGGSQPAHLIDRSIGGTDDPRAVVPLCPPCHRAYDEEDLDLLPSLEPHYREELAYAVECAGLLAALFRISGDRWVPAEGTA